MRRMVSITEPEFMGGIYYKRNKEHFMHDPELREAFEEGYKCGRKEAYEEIMSEQYGERRYDDRSRILYREHLPDDDMVYDERRRRRANGRFY